VTAAADAITVREDLLGPRYTFTWHDGDDERGHYELYAGEWTSVWESLGEDCCWHELRTPLPNVSDAIRMALGKSQPFPVDGVVTAHLDWAKRLGGRKGAAMRRSLTVQLAKHGLSVKGEK
jgi:hypothetical protein